jgi:serine protease
MRTAVRVVSRLIQTLAVLACAAFAHSAETNSGVRHAPPAARFAPDRIIVLWKSDAESMKSAQLATQAQESGTSITATRQLMPRMQLLQLGSQSLAASARMLAAFRADPRVAYAGYDQRRFPHAVTPNDPDFPYISGVSGQWSLQSVQPAAIHADEAWSIAKGSKGVVIADLDTGIRYDHPDLMRATAGGKLLPGYDFVSDISTANDGTGRDADASDPGDWVTATEANNSTGPFYKCTQPDPNNPGKYLAESSSWHGTRTAGILAALTNNTIGVAGVNWNAYILPVRVLGKCGGIDTDIIDGMRWAAGIHVNGVPDNPYPARIINMSLGGTGQCVDPRYLQVVDQLTALGVTVVASAGNDGDAVASPANCPGVVAVAGLRHIGTKVGFSNLGPEIALSAPGGNCVNTNGGPCLFSIDTTVNSGTTTPANNTYTDEVNYNVGTSFSAPLVAGVASLMLGVDQNLTPGLIRARLQEGASTPFPNPATDPDTGQPVPMCLNPATTSVQDFQCNCTTATCGAGMLNANGALTAASRPIASIVLPASVSPGASVSLDGSRSVAACSPATATSHTIASYHWDPILPPTTVITNATTAHASVLAPATGSIVVRLTVTDDAGKTDTADLTITTSSATSTAPVISPVASCPTDLNIAPAAIPTTTLSVAPLTIATGGSATLTWSSTDADSCTAGGTWTGAKTTADSQSTGALTTTSSFTLFCSGPGGNSTTKSVTVTVTAAPPPPTKSGGGVLDLLSMLALAALLAWRCLPARKTARQR